MSHSAVVRGTRSRFRLGSPKYRAVPVVKIDKCANGWNCPRPCEKSLSWRKPRILLLLGQCIRSYRHITAYTATLYCSMIGADRLFTQPRPKADLRDYLCCWSGCVGDGRRSRRPSRFKRHCPFCTKELSFPIAGAYDWCSLARRRTADSEPAGIGVYARRGIPDRRRPYVR